MVGIAPRLRIVDLTHGVPRHDVRRGALVLRNALPYLPAAVVLAVVDPQVGGERRAVALRCDDGRLLVGPDNGLLSLAWERAGGVHVAVDVTRSPHRLDPVSATFHGRDLFAPVAAALATGATVEDAGEPIDPATLTALELPRPRVEADGALAAHAVAVDGYGNVTLDAGHADLAGTGLTLGARVEVEAAGRTRRARFTTAFADVPPGETILYEDASRSLALAVNRGDAAAELGLEPDAEVRLRPA